MRAAVHAGGACTCSRAWRGRAGGRRLTAGCREPGWWPSWRRTARWSACRSSGRSHTGFYGDRTTNQHASQHLPVRITTSKPQLFHLLFQHFWFYLCVKPAQHQCDGNSSGSQMLTMPTPFSPQHLWIRRIYFYRKPDPGYSGPQNGFRINEPGKLPAGRPGSHQQTSAPSLMKPSRSRESSSASKINNYKSKIWFQFLIGSVDYRLVIHRFLKKIFFENTDLRK